MTLKRSEHGEQEAFFAYVKLKSLSDWRYELVVAHPNGGKRSSGAGRYMVREGLSAGFPDVGIYYAASGWNAAFIEFKSEKGRLTEAQQKWLFRLNKAGYLALVLVGADPAIRFIDNYFAGKY